MEPIGTKRSKPIMRLQRIRLVSLGRSLALAVLTAKSENQHKEDEMIIENIVAIFLHD